MNSSLKSQLYYLSIDVGTNYRSNSTCSGFPHDVINTYLSNYRFVGLGSGYAPYFSVTGRKSGKGCYIYGGRKKSVNTQAGEILQKYLIENKGRWVCQCYPMVSYYDHMI